MQRKKLTIVNRHYPPNVNITGENAWDLANYLIMKHNVDVAVVHIDRSYEGGGGKREPVGRVFPVRTVYEGKNRIFRYLSGMMDGYNLMKKAAALDHGPVIVMTSPPLLPMWASRILSPRNKKWFLWSMDLFPEGFSATGEISASSPFYRFAIRNTYKNAPDKLIALGPGQKSELEKKYGKKIEGVILPCGVFADQQVTTATPAWKEFPEKIYFGYCGNCGNPHSADFVKACIDSIDPQRHHMILAIYGTKADSVKAYAAGKPGVSILQSVPRAELHHIDVHLVTLVSSWTHVAVPSKAVSSVCSGATILFCGSRESDNWQLLQQAGWQLDDDENMKTSVKHIVASLTQEEIIKKKKVAAELAKKLNELVRGSYDTIASWL